MDRAFVAENEASRKRLQALVGRLSDEELSRTLAHGWTVAVALAHLAFFDRRTAHLIRRWQTDGYSPSPNDFDMINDAMAPAWKLIPPRAAANEALAAAEEADAAVAGLSDALLAVLIDKPDIRLKRSEHRLNHIAEVEALL